MVRLISDGRISAALGFCSGDPIGARVGAFLRAYRTDYDFALFWEQVTDERITAVIGKTDGNMTVCASEAADFDEISEFVKVIGYQTLFSHSFLLNKLKIENVQGDILRLEELKEPTAKAEDFAEAKELYLLGVSSGCDNSKEAYLPWLSDFTFRQKRNMLRAVGFKDENGRLVSCAATSAETKTDAIISAVATEEGYRKRGLAKDCVLSLSHILKKERKDNIYLMTKSKKLTNYYEKLGFVKIGEWGEADRSVRMSHPSQI